MTELWTREKVDTFQSNMKMIRLTMQMSERELGDLVGVTKQTINNMETKRTPLKAYQYIAFTQVINYIVDNEPERIISMDHLKMLLNGDIVLDVNGDKFIDNRKAGK